MVSIAKKYTNRAAIPDLIQEGNIGLMKLLKSLNIVVVTNLVPTQLGGFRHYRAIADQARTIRIPVHMIETINKLVRTNRA